MFRTKLIIKDIKGESKEWNKHRKAVLNLWSFNWESPSLQNTECQKIIVDYLDSMGVSYQTADGVIHWTKDPK